jgi:hypothetical protein
LLSHLSDSGKVAASILSFFQQLNSIKTGGRIHITSFSLQLTNGT